MNQERTWADMSQIQALQQKRTLAFVNHFVTTNVQFLNNFMKNCEQKLMSFERKLEKVNAAMVLLEARLSSIPELTHNTPQSEATESPTIAITEAIASTTEAIASTTEAIASTTEETNSRPEQSEDNTTKQARPEYDRFIKMVQVGVPVQAVKLKVSLEGLDPNVLEEILGK